MTTKTTKTAKAAPKTNVFALITAEGKAERKLAGGRVLINDQFKADGVKVQWFKSPGKEGEVLHTRFFDKLNVAIIEGFEKVDQKLLAAPIKSLDADQKAARRYAQNQIGGKRYDYQTSFKNYLNPKSKTKTKGADKRTDDKTFCLERVAAMLKRLEKSEGAPFDIIEVQSALVKVAKALSTKA